MSVVCLQNMRPVRTVTVQYLVRVCACVYGSCACFCSITHFWGIWCVRPFLACICGKTTTALRDTTKTTKLISITILWMRIILCIHNLKCEMPNLLAELKRSENCAKCLEEGANILDARNTRVTCGRNLTLFRQKIK